MVANSLGESSYKGLTLGLRKRLSRSYQFEANYVLANDEDNDSNERDPFTDRSFNFQNLDLDWGPSDRDIRHKVNAFGYFAGPIGLQLTTRVQYRSAQPITPNPRSLNGVDRGRNSARKDNEFYGLVSRGLQVGRKVELSRDRMFNTFNNANNINPLSTNLLFNFEVPAHQCRRSKWSAAAGSSRLNQPSAFSPQFPFFRLRPGQP